MSTFYPQPASHNFVYTSSTSCGMLSLACFTLTAWHHAGIVRTAGISTEHWFVWFFFSPLVSKILILSACAGAPQNHWFGPAGDPRAAGIGTPEAIRLVWSCHREIIHDNGPIPADFPLTQT